MPVPQNENGLVIRQFAPEVTIIDHFGCKLFFVDKVVPFGPFICMIEHIFFKIGLPGTSIACRRKILQKM